MSLVYQLLTKKHRKGKLNPSLFKTRTGLLFLPERPFVGKVKWYVLTLSDAYEENLGSSKVLATIKEVPYLIAGNEEDVPTANATKSVIVVMVTVAPECFITALIFSIVDSPHGCRSRSSTMINMSSMPILRTRKGTIPTILGKGTRNHIPRPSPAKIPRATANTPAVASREWPVSGFKNFPSMMQAKEIIRL